MEALSGVQKKYLRGLAHGLKPVVLIGAKGLNEAALQYIDEALETHELVKVKFNEFKEKAAKKQILASVQARLNCAVAGTIGHTAVIYRARRDPAERRITLPQAEPGGEAGS